MIGDTLQTILKPWNGMVGLPDLPFDPKKIQRITLVACGTSFHAGMVARYWFETVAGVPCDIDIASEFRYRKLEMQQSGMSLFISQSGETADTLAALRYAKTQGQHIVSVVNVAESSMARESDVVLLTKGGAGNRRRFDQTFTTQLTTLACFVIGMASARGKIDRTQEASLCHALLEVPSRANDVLNHDEAIEKLAHEVIEARDVLYLGRGTGFPIALEGALKLKEISLHTCRRICCGRDEARAYRADRRRCPGHSDRPV